MGCFSPTSHFLFVNLQDKENKNNTIYNGRKELQKNHSNGCFAYANGGVHIGHLAGVYIPADIYVRYLRLKGEEVAFYLR